MRLKAKKVLSFIVSVCLFVGSTRISAAQISANMVETNLFTQSSPTLSDKKITDVIYDDVDNEAVVVARLNKRKLTLNKGECFSLKIKHISKKIIIWKSSNPKVAKVNKNGKVIALKKGNAKITAKIKGENEKLTCKVTVKKGKNIPILKLKKPKIKVSCKGKKVNVKYYKVKNATGFQLKSYVIKDYKIKGNTVTEIKSKTITKNYNTKKTVTKSIKHSTTGLSTVCKVRAFNKKNGKITYSKWRKVEIAEAVAL